MKPIKPVLAAAAALALASTLAACSSGDAAGPGATGGGTGSNPALSDSFDWSRASHGPAQTIELVLPDELVAIAPELENLTAVPTSATARELDSASMCAVDVTYDFPQGVDAFAGGVGMSEDELRDEAAIQAWGQYGKFQGDGVTNADEQREWLVEQETEAILRLEESSGIKQNVEGGVASKMQWYDSRFEEALEALRQDQEGQLGRTDGQSMFGADARPIDELDSADPEDGSYYSADLETLTMVWDCASDPLDASSYESAWFHVRTSDDEEHPFATAYMTSTKNGDIYIFDAEVRNYETDTNGDWIAD